MLTRSQATELRDIYYKLSRKRPWEWLWGWDDMMMSVRRALSIIEAILYQFPGEFPAK